MSLSTTESKKIAEGHSHTVTQVQDESASNGVPIPQPTSALNPFLHDLGVEFLEMDGGNAKLTLDLTERHMNSWQIVHGGVLMTMLDVVMAMAGRSLCEDLKGVVTVEMKTTFLQPGGITGGHIEARGHAFHRSTTMCFCEGEIWNGDKLVAKAMGTFKYLRRLKSGENMKKLYGSD
ncbi:PaaI family thioesterase [Undibacterium sp. RTI2.1]|uniref:PaaI family thioesterase n=1 Tax=unclassified Undibacterium TaxID=2630295 RepID=UPI002AB3BC39|nr:MULTISPECIES: PaaI family thioesterase [unclassified Undibacterium]MDY7537309.1 PaaI family thioesterase [Undibacterium sp. 5I1]MEB0032119.1 PaaI family thioesterase [Undibacterium sp. RTI2.1]MEB0118381.1 PaaI family thioesterase [Undibacterium sp. RTI2.2]MEB0231752.1 PaaI family thioesterase [Undibacterium sp. 10I3]MEB0259235.1 PaaI family thioesterase [Undibacterium sp. 5I1]